MKKGILTAGLLSLILAMGSCSNDDSLSSTSVLPNEEVVLSELDHYLDSVFTKTYNIAVLSKWDRSQIGVTQDILRNLYPPKEENVRPAMEMVDHVWIKTYEKVAGKQFLDRITPYEFILAGGSAFNDNGTRTLGVAAAGIRISLYETDYVAFNVNSAREFIHTIQHEYIHIITQNQPFVERDYGIETLPEYRSNWNDLNEREALELGFITPYSSLNIFEDFAEMATYMLTTPKAQYEAMLESFKEPNSNNYRKGRGIIINKVEFIRNYFSDKHGIDFDELARVANEQAASSPLLNGGGSAGRSSTPFHVNSTGYRHRCNHSF